MVEDLTFQFPIGITVVITNCRRPDMLWEAFLSCRGAGVSNLVISSSCADSVVESVHQRILAIMPSVVIISEQGDSGNNANWIKGVRAAQTSHVVILHDDDRLTPDFVNAETYLGEDRDVILWDATSHGTNAGSLHRVIPDAEGYYEMDRLYELLTAPGLLSVSPVTGCFRREHLLRTLWEADRLGPSFWITPTFLIGNDLLIWLRASQWYERFYYVPLPMVSFGYHPESATVKDCALSESKLAPIYDKVRSYVEEFPNAPDCSDLPLHIITIVKDGMPFIRRHHDIFKALSVDWTWHISEGSASPEHCTSWCAEIAPGLSTDGTREYLTSVEKSNARVAIYRRELWNGKIEMVNASLGRIKRPTLVMEIDADEIWSVDQIEKIVRMFRGSDHNCAYFRCRYFVGEKIEIITRNCYAMNDAQDWRRAWIISPGQIFSQHEPPLIGGVTPRPFTQDETEALGMVFLHYAYVTEAQVAFKERYYRYPSAVEQWKRLQANTSWPVRLGDFLSWVKDDTMVAKTS